MKKKHAIFLIASLLTVFLGLGILMVPVIKNLGKVTEAAENIPESGQLPGWVRVPPTAKNISYLKVFGLYHAFEFDVPEKDFLEWASQWPVQPIEDRETFFRYTKYITPQPNTRDSNSLEEYDSRVYKTIRHGYYFYKENENQNGGGVLVAYDRDTQRAYYAFSFR